MHRQDLPIEALFDTTSFAAHLTHRRYDCEFSSVVTAIMCGAFSGWPRASDGRLDEGDYR